MQNTERNKSKVSAIEIESDTADLHSADIDSIQNIFISFIDKKLTVLDNWLL